jgi:outer membrane protein assembly factor BamB
MSSVQRIVGLGAVILATLATAPAAPAGQPAGDRSAAARAIEQIGVERGICVVLGLPDAAGPEFVVDLARRSELTVYFQSPQAGEVDGVRQQAAAAGLLGRRVFADQGDGRNLHLADNLADAILVAPGVEKDVADAEILRALHPEGLAIAGGRRLVKPGLQGVDQWSHVFHGPDNNPLSTDQLARAPYLTQFLADPKFCPMPEVSVAAGGRVFRAFGHIAHKANQNALLNTLLGINGYNGTILWRRPLKEGYMIHRNTLVATPDVLYLADDESCKLIDARTGRLKDQITIPAGLADGPVWKWMALDAGVLYALVGGEEIRPQTQPSQVTGMGHWPWGMWQGHDYKDPQTNFGFGRTLVAIDPHSKKIRWSYRQPDYIDARGVAMRNGQIYFYSPGKLVGCLTAASGQVAWKNADPELLEAIGRDGPAQLWITGYATTTFLKCNDQYLFFAGPQRSRLVVASTRDGKLVWQKEPGNLQLVLRDDSMYCAGAQQTVGYRLAYATGQPLGLLPARRACTRATGTVDSVFFRASGGTVRLDLASGTAKHIAPMRPPCQDGVIVSDGLLYWGPWMCGCELSLYGHICLGPAGRFDYRPQPGALCATETAADRSAVRPFAVDKADWPTYLGDDARSGVSRARLPKSVSRRWTYGSPGGVRPTAPVMAGDRVFLGDESGAVRALDARDGSVCWQARTGGAIFFPPALWQGRLYAGSADGRVYAFEAATGRPLWTFRAAPAERWIPVYGKLLSTWPVAGGVVAADGVVYAAAGIAHYDGTYVYALDAVTGRVKWCNDSSGSLSEKVDCGISLQGPLYLADGDLRFLGGGKYETARYDLATGKCLNQPDDSVVSRFRTAFYPYYPDYGCYTSLEHALGDGRELSYDASYEGSQQTALALWPPRAPGAARPAKPESRWPLARRGEPRCQPLWTDRSGSRFNAFVVAADGLLAAGRAAAGRGDEPFLALLDTATGADLWRQSLPAASVKCGLAVDHRGWIVAALENGQVLAFAGPE